MKKITAIVLVAILVVSLAACSGGSQSSSTPAATAFSTEGTAATTSAGEAQNPAAQTEKVTIRLATINAGVMTASTLYAQEHGYFDEAGLALDIIPFNTGSEMFEAIPSGEWDITLIGASITTAIAGYDIKIIGQVNWDDYAVECYVRPDSEIAQAGQGHIDGFPDIYGTPEMWKGKTIITPAASTAHNMVVRTLNAMGLTENDVNIVGMDIATGLTAFKSGQGDMLAVWFPSSYASRADGYVAASSCYAVNMHLPFYVACTEDFYENHADLAQKFMEVTFRGLAESEANPEETTEYYYEFCVEAGSSLDYDNVLDFITIKAETNPSLNLDQQLAKFTVGADGSSAAIEEINEVFDFYIAQGRFTEEDKTKTEDSISASILQAIKDAQ